MTEISTGSVVAREVVRISNKNRTAYVEIHDRVILAVRVTEAGDGTEAGTVIVTSVDPAPYGHKGTDVYFLIRVGHEVSFKYSKNKDGYREVTELQFNAAQLVQG